jgi:hypothetical protein
MKSHLTSTRILQPQTTRPHLPDFVGQNRQCNLIWQKAKNEEKCLRE